MYVSGILPHFYKCGCLILEFSNKNLGARSLLSRPFSGGRRSGWWKERTPMQRGMVELVTTMDHSPTGGCLRNHIECISKLSLWWFWDIHTDPHISLAVGCFHRQWPSNTCGPSLLCWTAFLDIKEGKKKKNPKTAERPPSRHLRWGHNTMWNCPTHLTLHQEERWWHEGHHKRLKC